MPAAKQPSYEYLVDRVEPWTQFPAHVLAPPEGWRLHTLMRFTGAVYVVWEREV